ncbi:MAG: hypothetical protein RI909_2190 [Bacteroidota bacterium]
MTSSDAFAKRPVDLILQDLEWGEKLYEEELHFHELGISALSSLMLNINRDPKTPPVKSSDFYHFMRSKAGVFNAIVCDTFVSLLKDSLMPPFIFDATPPDILQSIIDGKKGGNVSKIRAYVGEGLLILCPVVVNGFVTAPFGCSDSLISGLYEVKDVDTGDRYEVNVRLDPEVEGVRHAFDECSWMIRPFKSLIIV